MCTKDLYEDYKFSCHQANLIYPEIYTTAMQGASALVLIQMFVKENAYGSVLSDFLAWVSDCKNKRKLMTDTCYKAEADVGHKLPIVRSETLIKAIRDYKDYALRKLEESTYKVGLTPCLPFRDMMNSWKFSKGVVKVNYDDQLIVGRFSKYPDIIYKNDRPIQWPLNILKRMMEIVCFLKLNEPNATWRDIASSWSDETTKPYVLIYAKVDEAQTTEDRVPHELIHTSFSEQDLVWASLMFLAQIRYWTS